MKESVKKSAVISSNRRKSPMRYYEVEFKLVVQARSADDALRVGELSITDMDWDSASVDMHTRKASLAPQQIEWAKGREQATEDRRLPNQAAA